MIDYTLDSYQLDRLQATQQAQSTAQQARKAQSSVITQANDITATNLPTATREILFASNALFWLGVACLEAPQHVISQLEDASSGAAAGSAALSQL